jgi:hypothetical protein
MSSPTTSNRGFFAVGQESFIQACELGITEASAFLVLARGSGEDNISTNWSAEAAKTRLHIRWTSAKRALEALVESGIVSRHGTGSRPSYKLDKQGEAIWLPNSLIDGAGSEIPPIARIRQTQDPMCLQLLVELYSAQNLREDGGISPDVVYMNYDRERIGQRGQFAVWSFHSHNYSVKWGEVSEPHRRDEADLTDEELEAGSNAGVDFFRRFSTLLSLGLVQWVPYLFEGKNGEPIHPLWESSEIGAERAVADSCARAAFRCLTEGQIDYFHEQSDGELIAPVPAHIGEVAVIGIARLRYRPHTKMTSA